MTNTALDVNSLRDGKNVSNLESNFPRSDGRIPTMFASVVEDTWMLTIGYSALHYAITESFARHNVEILAAFTDALGPFDAGDKFEGWRGDLVESSSVPSLEDFLASDRLSIECKALGGEFESNLTMSLRRDLILASSVVC